MTPEEQSHIDIDAQLTACGWVVQTKDKINLSASKGVATCELSFTTGEPDYTPFVEGKTIGNLQHPTRLCQSILKNAFTGKLVDHRDFAEHA